MSPTKPDTTYLQRRHLTWFCVYPVPRPLHSIMGKRLLVESLKTHDLTEARRLRHRVVARFTDDIAAAGKGRHKTSTDAVAFDPVALGIEDREAGMADTDAAFNYTDRAEFIELRHGTAAALAYARVASGRSTPISHYAESWLSQSTYPARSKVQHRGTLRELERWCATTATAADLASITRKAAGEWIDGAVKAKSARDTINRKLSTFRGYWEWLVSRGHAGDNPWTGQRIKKGRLAEEGSEEDRSRAFTDDEMRALLAGNADAVLSDFIRIAALSGCRLESLAKLKVGDCINGIFNIRRDKSRSGTRPVPIHSALTELVANRCKDRKADDWLFPECSTTGTGSRSSAVGKRFHTYRVGLGIDDNPDGRRRSLLTFHSLRNWYITTALRAGQSDPIVEQIIGHKAQRLMRVRYFSGATLDALRQCIESVKLPTPAAPDAPPDPQETR